MNLGVHLSRLSQLPQTEGVVREAAHRRHRVWLLLDTALAGGPKADQMPSSVQIPARFARWAEFISVTPTGLSGVVAALGLDWLVMGYAPHLPGWRPPGATRLAFLQGAVTDLAMLDDPGRWDRVYAWSQTWRAIWRHWSLRSLENVSEMDRAFLPVGFPLGEHLAWINPGAVRATFGLGDKPVVILLPFPFHPNTRSLWADAVWGMPWPFVATDRRFVRALRGFCDRAGALLVVKGRPKTPLRSYVREAADVVVEADEPGEPTALRLLTCATLLVHFCSLGVTEAAAAGVLALCLTPSPRQWPQYSGRMAGASRPGRRAGALPELDPHALWNLYYWSGVSSVSGIRRPGEAISALDTAEVLLGGVAFGRDSYVNRVCYVDRFLGGEPFRAGARVVEDMEADQ